MKKLGLIIKALIIFSIVFFLGTCTAEGKLYEVSLFPEEVWGEWIRMDTGDIWYFSSNYRIVKNSYSTSPVNMVRQSQNVIKVTEGTGTNSKDYFLYASRIRNSTFEATAVTDENNVSMALFSRAGIFLPTGDKAIVIPELIHEDIQEITISDNGEFTAENIIAGDNYIVTIDGYEFMVTPQTDGDNVGVLTLTNGVNIKTSIAPQSSSTDMMRLYSGQSYNLKIIFTNVGKDVSSAMEYRLTVPPEIEITKIGDSTTRLNGGELQSFMPGQTREVNFTVKCGSIMEEFEFKNIEIDTEDFYGKTWKDSVSLRINKESLTFQIRSNLAINGVIIVPTGKTYHFTTTGYGDVRTTDITVPKYQKDYLVVFSGASANTEAKYSFAIDKTPGTDFANYSLTGAEGLNKYWPNGTEEQASTVHFNEEVRAYLMMNQANYYRVSFGK